MRTRFAIALGGLFSFLCAVEAQAASLDGPVPFPGHVEALPGLIYESLDGFRPLTLDLYQIPPKANEPPRPAIVFVHGGNWRSGDARHAGLFEDFPATLAALAGKNYVVASVNYRLSGEAHFPAAVQDVKKAIRWLRGHAADYGLDTTRVMVWGMEAGGQIAALVGASCGVGALEPAADANVKTPLASDCVEGVIDWAGPADLVSWDAREGRTLDPGAPTPLGAYLGCEPADCAPGVVRAASPLSYLNTMTPPFLIQHGAADKDVPLAQSRQLYDALQKLGVPSELVVYPDAGENFARDGILDNQVNAKLVADMESFVVKTFPPIPIGIPLKPAKKSAPSGKRTRRR
jgi:acetyl esterase/lipase